MSARSGSGDSLLAATRRKADETETKNHNCPVLWLRHCGGQALQRKALTFRSEICDITAKARRDQIPREARLIEKTKIRRAVVRAGVVETGQLAARTTRNGAGS